MVIEVGNVKMVEVLVIFIYGWLDNVVSFLLLMFVLYVLDFKLYLCVVDLFGYGFFSYKVGYFVFYDYIDDFD